MNDRDRDAADDWIRDHMPDPDQFSLEDNEERRDEQLYYFLRYRDSAMVVYRIKVKGGMVVSVKKEVYIDEVFEGNPQEERWIVKPQGRECGADGARRSGRREGKR
ncbi:MAG: hypothetical protein JXA57_07790 [Armatimonadetes bacterium]|nr:hypothetical protein [Armatimonadota bacterium]